jgi:hypothetical protein
MCLNEACSTVPVDNNICKFPIQNGLKQGDFSAFIFNVALEYAIRRVQENQ